MGRLDGRDDWQGFQLREVAVDKPLSYQLDCSLLLPPVGVDQKEEKGRKSLLPPAPPPPV